MNQGNFLSPRVLQIAGLVIIAVGVLYSVLAKHQLAGLGIFVGAGLALCTLGIVNGRLISIRQEFYEGTKKPIVAEQDSEQ